MNLKNPITCLINSIENIHRRIAVHFIIKYPIKVIDKYERQPKYVEFKDVDGTLYVEQLPAGHVKIKYKSYEDAINAVYDRLEELRFYRFMGHPYDEGELDFVRNKANQLLQAVIDSERKIGKTFDEGLTRWTVWQCHECGKIMPNNSTCSGCGAEYVGNFGVLL